MHRRQSILSHRPKTSSAVDDAPRPKRFDTGMKRTASQIFRPQSPTHDHDIVETGMPLGRIKEGTTMMDLVHEHPHHRSQSTSHYPSDSQSFTAVVSGSVKYICRRLSSSSRRPSLSELGSNKMRKGSHDSSVPESFVPSLLHAEHHAPSTVKLRSGGGLFRKLSASISRRPAASGPSGDTAKFNPGPPPIPANYPPILPGSAARAAAAAANKEKREAEQTARFLANGASNVHMEDVTNDNESGVGMTCSPPIDSLSMPEKRIDPLQKLPSELFAMILSNLDAETLATAERVSHWWNEHASCAHVWRQVFLRQFEQEVHVSPAPIMMGGAGIGKYSSTKPAAGQAWKKMYKVRKTIDRRWKAGTPSAIYLNGHTDSVYCCQFDENKIITGSRDRTIRVWDMNTYKCLKVIGGPANTPVANTPPALETHKETVINHASMNGTFEGRSIYHVPEDYHEASILCLQYDHEIMVTGSSDHTCIVWDITGQEYVPKYRLRRHSAGVLDVCLDDKHIISCSKDATINVWDRATGDHIRELTGHRGPVNAVQLRGNLLVSASGDGIAKLWNLDSGICIKEFPSQDRGLAAVEFSDDAKYVLAGGNDHVVYKFDANSGQLLHTSRRHGGLVRSLFLDAHNGRVISGSYDQSIRVSDYDSGEIFGQYDNWTTSWILSAKSDYRRVVATSQDGRALILDFGWNVDGKDLLVAK